MLKKIATHLINTRVISVDLLVEDASPHEGVKLELRVFRGSAVDEEVEIEVPADGEEIILDVLDLLELSEDLHIFHFRGNQLVKTIDQFLSKLEGELVLGEVSQALVNEPDMHVGD